jgi:hypothetical protein
VPKAVSGRRIRFDVSVPELTARDPLMRRMGLASLTESEDRLVRFCRQNGVHVLALAPPMGEYAAANNVFLRGLPGNRAIPASERASSATGMNSAIGLRAR